MKTWKCPDCKSETETPEDIIMIVCGCGKGMKEIFKEVKNGETES